jgi:hypothetical protein
MTPEKRVQKRKKTIGRGAFMFSLHRWTDSKAKSLLCHPVSERDKRGFKELVGI